MSGDALELALALHRAPIQRFALRDRPLPDDIGVALQLASANPQLLQAAAARLCEPEATLLEAVRFYLQQVLFNPGTDAYRVLGLAPGAPPERIREHYRWLQRWLHPDRRGEEWEALFATRVNWAWRQLRSDPARQAYDAEHSQPTPAPREPIVAIPKMAVGEWKAIPTAPPRASWPKRLALAVSLGSCLGLLYLALTRIDPMPPDESGGGQSEHREPPGAAIGSRPGDRKIAAAAVTEAAASSPTSSTLPVAATPAAKPAASPAVAPAAIGVQPVASQPAPASELTIPPLPAPPKPSSMERAAIQPMTSESIAAPAHASHVDVPALAPRAAAPPPRSPQLAETGEPPIARHPAAATMPQRIAPTQAPSAASVMPARTVAVAAMPEVDAADHAAAMPTNAQIAVTQQSAPALADDEAQATRSTQPVADAAMLSERMDMAGERLDDLSAYFGRQHTPPPPVWNDLDGQLSAERERDALHDRARMESSGRFEIVTPDWRLSSDAAALQARYRLSAGRRVFESGHLSLAMVWRAKMWLVTRVELRPDP